MFEFLKKKKTRNDELQVLLDDFKKSVPRRLWQEVDDIKNLNDIEYAKRFLRRLTSLHPQGMEASEKIIAYLSQNHS